MWQRLPEEIVQERLQLLAKKKGIPKIVQSLFATIIFGAVCYGIAYLNGLLQGDKMKPGESFSLHNASALSLIAVFVATIAFMYFLLVKNRKPPVIFICYDCQEPFHVQSSCPACNSLNISDIRFAEWIED